MRRLEAGPLLVALGALLLVVSLFLTWYSGDLELGAWDVFEVWDLVLAALALAALAAAVGLLSPDVAVVDRRWLPVAVVAALVVVAVQILDPPPSAAGLDPDTGAWLALGAAALMAVGALLTFSRVRLALTVEGRDPRRHVPAVDARGGDAAPATSEQPAAAGGGGLFGRARRVTTEPAAPAGAATSDEVAAARAEEEEPLLRSRARRRQRAAETGDPNEERPG